MSSDISAEFYWIAVALVTVLSASRLTRLAVWDKFPPAKYLRTKFIVWTDQTNRRRGWQILAFCGYCAAFWTTLAVVFFGWLCGVYGHDPFGGESDLDFAAWWYFNGTLAACYLAAIVMSYDGSHDGDPDEDDA